MILRPTTLWRLAAFGLWAASLAAPAARATVFGTDDRVGVADTSAMPNSAVVHLMFATEFGTSTCSGAMVGPNIVLTAGNCIHSGTRAGRTYGNFRVIPGRNGAAGPWGACGALKAVTMTGWTEAETLQDAREYNLGALILDCDIGLESGWFRMDRGSGIAVGDAIRLIGYAADKVPALSQWESPGTVTGLADGMVFYRNDTFGGASGAPIMAARDPATIVAIHTSGAHGEPPYAENNSGLRMTETRQATIRAWIEEAGRLRNADAKQAVLEERARAEAAWARIEGDSSVVALEDFLLRHPGSRFAETARKRISELEDATFIRRKIAGSRIEPISVFGAGTALRRMAAPVGLLRVAFAGVERELTCTAFLVGRAHALTSLSCLQGPGDRRPESATLVLNRTDARSGGDEATFAVDVTPAEADDALGYALLRVAGAPGETWGSLPLSDNAPQPGEALTVVHHPGGIEQYVTRGRCRSALTGRDPAPDTFAHTCDTLIGSAGAPIFAEGGMGAVAGLHLSGFEPLDDGDPPNGAVSMRAILERSEVLGGVASAAIPRGQAPDAPTGDAEDRFWAIIGGKDDPDLLRAYLRDFPDGRYRTEAEQRLRDLEILNARLDPEPSDLGETVSSGPVSVRAATVFIECDAGGDRRRGAGVIIGGDGRVLTALHIEPDQDYECWAALGSSAARPDRRLAWRKAFRDADTVMLQLVEPFEEAGAVSYVALADDHLLGEAVSYGFPRTGGKINARLGRISDTFEHGIGFIEIDGLKTEGMAGAPVVLGTNGPLIGLVVGREFGADRRPIYMGVISAKVLSGEFGLSRR